MDFNNEEDAKTSLSPNLVVEVLGISTWDGVGRANQYANGFLVVTHTGATYYFASSSPKEREEWMLQVRRALECNFANPEVVPFKPSKMIIDRPPKVNNTICPVAKTSLTGLSNISYCYVCGKGFSLPDFVQESIPILQLGVEEAERVCSNCYRAQVPLLFLKMLNYVQVTLLHDRTTNVRKDIERYKSTFKLARRKILTLDKAARMLESKNVTREEFEELRAVSENYYSDCLFEESFKFRGALQAIGDDFQMIISLLLNTSAADSGGRFSYFEILVKIFSLSETRSDLIDFFWPQLIQIHLLTAGKIMMQDPCSTFLQLDLIQQMLLVIAKKFPPLAMKLAWALIGTISDFFEFSDKRVLPFQYAASFCLLLQLEHTITGAISCLGDVPLSQYLSSLVQFAPSQQQDMAFEMTVLWLSRRRLQESFDNEANERRLVYAKNSFNESSTSTSTSSNAPSNTSSSNSYPPSSCLNLFYCLGVGQDSNSDENSGCLASLSWMGFVNQLDFMKHLTDMVDNLRFVDRPLRTETLRQQLDVLCISTLESANSTALRGWDPSTSAGEPCYNIVRILPSECRVFRTKARAPSLIVCEVKRDDSNVLCNPLLKQVDHLQDLYMDSKDSSRHRGSSISLIDEVEGIVTSEIGGAIADINLQKSKNSMSSSDHAMSPTIYRSNSAGSMSNKDFDSPKPTTSRESIFSVSNASMSKRQSFISSNKRASFYMNSMESISGDEISRMSTCISGNSTSSESSGTIFGDDLSDGDLFDIVEAPIYEDNRVRKVFDNNRDLYEQGLHPVNTAYVTRKVFLSAQKLLISGNIDTHEYNLLVKSDNKYRDESAKEEAIITMHRVESAFGESWEAKKSRILEDRYNIMPLVQYFDANVDGNNHPINADQNCEDAIDKNDSEEESESNVIHWPLFDLRCFIVKSNDDLRQEVCCLQLMELCFEIFRDAGLSSYLWLKPYRIVSTGNSTGVVEVLADAMSIDALKKTPGFRNLSHYFQVTYGSSSETLNAAKKNFAASLAAYSLFCYFFAIKDRHNGNILLDTQGHIIHIDFGFILSIAPGGSFSLESAPFKLTEEYMDVLGGQDSVYFDFFVRAFSLGFLALRSHMSSILGIVDTLSIQSSFPCFLNKDRNSILEKLKHRFRVDLSTKDCVKHCMNLITSSYCHYGTRQYDTFQWYTNGIII